MCPTSGMSMPMGLCSSTPSRHQPSIALSTTTTTSARRRTRLAKSGARISVLKQFSGSRTPSGWRTKGRCVETWLSSSASSPPQCRNMLVLCPGRKTPFLSSQKIGFLLLLTEVCTYRTCRRKMPCPPTGVSPSTSTVGRRGRATGPGCQCQTRPSPSPPC
uniref:DS cell adhesion molecule like 1 n=1 Tax=Gallus gallus TaxID=9031 RepID=A0A8V0ZSF4_CHICK